MSVFTSGVELTASGVRGLAVHETARVTAQAGAGEIFVSEATKTLTSGPEHQFDDRGEHDLKGLTGLRRLYSYAPHA